MNNKKQYSKTNSSTHVLFEHVGEKSLKQSNNDFISWEEVCDDLLNNKKSIMVTDTNGTFFNQTAEARAEIGQVYLLDLSNDDVSLSTSINPIAEITPGFNAAAEARMLANALIELPKASNIDDHWARSAREWVTALILYIYYCETPENRHLARLYSLAIRGAYNDFDEADGLGFGELMKECAKTAPDNFKSHDQKAQKELDYIREKIVESGQAITCMNDREAASVISTMCRNLAFLRDPWIEKAIKKDTFSLKRFAQAPKAQTLYVHAPSGQQISDSFIKVIFRLVRNLLEASESQRQLEGLKIEQLGRFINSKN